MFQADTLANQTILITGGGSGLGRAMVERFASLGASVAILGRRVGEWLRTGQSFSNFLDYPREQIEAVMAAMKPKKG